MISTFLLAILQFLLIVYICYYEYKLKSPTIFMWLTVFIMFGFMHLMTIISDTTIYPKWVMDFASIFVIIFCVLYLITRRLFNLKKIKYIFFDNDESNRKNQIKYFDYFLYFIFLIIIFYKNYKIYNNSGFLNSSWGSNREITIGDPTYNFILWFYFISTGVLIISLFKKRKFIFTIISVLIIFNSILSRNRIEILPLFITILTYMLFNNRLTLKKIFLLVTISFLILYFVYGLIVFRHFGTIEMFVSSTNFKTFNNVIFEQIREGDGELNLKDVFYYFIYNDNNFQNFNKGHTYIRMILVLIPTDLSFGIKPPDFAISMGYAVNPHLKGFSTHPTIFGDCYANFGFYGVFLGIFWAIFFSIIDNLIKKKDQTIKICLFSLCSTIFIILGRGSVYNSFSILVWGYIIIIIIYKISKYITQKTKFHH